MLLFDYSQWAINSIMGATDSDPTVPLDDEKIRHILLSSIVYYSKLFKKKYGPPIFCCDDYSYWRKKEFAYYKAQRKERKQKSDFDWATIDRGRNKFKDDLVEHFPFKVVQAEDAEADDVIAVLCKYTQSNEMLLNEKSIFEEPEKQPVLIVSADKDFLQLQRYSNVSQHSPREKKLITTPTPLSYLREHIIRGDSGDGIPNFMSDDNSFVIKKRQTSIYQKNVDVWLMQEEHEFLTEENLKKNFERNRKLIDFAQIPETVEAAVLEKYHAAKTENKVWKYLIQSNMSAFLPDIAHF